MLCESVQNSIQRDGCLNHFGCYEHPQVMATWFFWIFFGIWGIHGGVTYYLTCKRPCCVNLCKIPSKKMGLEITFGFHKKLPYLVTKLGVINSVFHFELKNGLGTIRGQLTVSVNWLYRQSINADIVTYYDSLFRQSISTVYRHIHT